MEASTSIPCLSIFTTVAVVVTVLALTPQHGRAQTPAQLEYERQQREYRLQQEREREQQQRQQQLMNENARRQQEESSRINAPAGQPSGGFAPGMTQGAPGAASGARRADPTGAQAASAARATWEKRPALPPDRNPILGKWKRPSSTRPNPSDPFGTSSSTCARAIRCSRSTSAMRSRSTDRGLSRGLPSVATWFVPWRRVATGRRVLR